MLRGGALLYLTTLFIANIIYVIGGSPMKYESTTNSMWTGVGSNPCFRSGVPNTNRLGRRTAHLKADTGVLISP